MAIRKVLDARVAGRRFDIPLHPRVEPLTVKSVLPKRRPMLHCVTAGATLLEALQLMAEHDVGAVMVLESGRLIGVFSERDYARSSTQDTQLAMPLREVMTSCDFVAGPNDSVQKCLSLMFENHLRYLPVQEGDVVIGLLSLEDFLAEMVAYLERVFNEYELDQQITFLSGTYSC
jgi:CBS domain-containing protein